MSMRFQAASLLNITLGSDGVSKSLGDILSAVPSDTAWNESIPIEARYKKASLLRCNLSLVQGMATKQEVEGKKEAFSGTASGKGSKALLDAAANVPNGSSECKIKIENPNYQSFKQHSTLLVSAKRSFFARRCC